MKPIPEILIVEDDRATRRLLGHHVKSLGYRADFAADGREALALWDGHDYDLILTDCSMPGMSGPELAAAVRASHEAKKRTVPIIAMTGFAEETASACLAAGIDDVIAKPFPKSELQRVLGRWTRPPAREMSEPPGAASQPVSESPEEAQHLAAMQSVTAIFIETVTEYLEAISAALRSGRRTNIADAAHKLKSAARLVGGLEVAQLCESLERAATDGSDAEIRKFGANLPDAINALQRSLLASLAN